MKPQGFGPSPSTIQWRYLRLHLPIPGSIVLVALSLSVNSKLQKAVTILIADAVTNSRGYNYIKALLDFEGQERADDWMPRLALT